MRLDDAMQLPLHVAVPVQAQLHHQVDPAAEDLVLHINADVYGQIDAQIDATVSRHVYDAVRQGSQ